MAALMLEAALHLATIGPVMPVNGKRPIWPDWPNRATREPAGPEWASATGVGLLTGERAGYFVLDVDGPAGVKTLEALEVVHGKLPITWCSHTGGGGAHLFFRYPGFAVRGSAGKLGKGLDVRGEGGQVVAPPSVHPSGAKYEWTRDPWTTPLADAPTWLLERLKPTPLPAPVRLVAPGGDTLRRASAYLAKIPPAVSGSGGHDTTWGAALAVVRGFGLGEDEAFELLWGEYNFRCEPAWNEKELRHKVQSAARDGRTAIGYLRDAVRALPAPRAAAATVDVAQPASRFTLEPLTALLAEVIPPTNWLLKRYVPACSFGELVGPPGKGKTTLMAWMVMEMAKLGRRCAIFEEEGSRRGLQRTLGRAFEVDRGDTAERVWFAHAQHLNLLDARDVKALADTLRGFDFVLLDSFNLVTPGLDEDKSKDMGPVIRDIRWLRDSLEIAVWLNHHSGKSKWKAGEVPRLGDGRGSSALPGALDAELSMRPAEKPEVGFIQFDLFVTKMREADDQVPAQRVSIARNGPAAILEMSEIDERTASEVDAHLTLKVLEFIIAAGHAGISKNQIEQRVPGNTDQKRAALQALKQSGRVEEVPHGQYTRWRAI